jgi:hypothetical protein
VKGIFIGGRMDSNRLDTELVTGPDDTNRDLTPIRNQDLFKGNFGHGNTTPAITLRDENLAQEQIKLFKTGEVP